MFDWSVGSEEIGKEIVKCVNLAKDGIHAVIMVFSIRSRFSEGEETTLERLQMFFGDRIVDYMILVFTGGDDLDEDETFMEYLSRVPAPVQVNNFTFSWIYMIWFPSINAFVWYYLFCIFLGSPFFILLVIELPNFAIVDEFCRLSFKCARTGLFCSTTRQRTRMRKILKFNSCCSMLTPL
jgi:AIG1 family